jgi:hypothetical protein
MYAIAEWHGIVGQLTGEYLSELWAMSHPQQIQRPVEAAAASPSAGAVQEIRQTSRACRRAGE